MVISYNSNNKHSPENAIKGECLHVSYSDTVLPFFSNFVPAVLTRHSVVPLLFFHSSQGRLSSLVHNHVSCVCFFVDLRIANTVTEGLSSAIRCSILSTILGAAVLNHCTTSRRIFHALHSGVAGCKDATSIILLLLYSWSRKLYLMWCSLLRQLRLLPCIQLPKLVDGLFGYLSMPKNVHLQMSGSWRCSTPQRQAAMSALRRQLGGNWPPSMTCLEHRWQIVIRG